jgi:hypothetical protein
MDTTSLGRISLALEPVQIMWDLTRKPYATLNNLVPATGFSDSESLTEQKWIDTISNSNITAIHVFLHSFIATNPQDYFEFLYRMKPKQHCNSMPSWWRGVVPNTSLPVTPGHTVPLSCGQGSQFILSGDKEVTCTVDKESGGAVFLHTVTPQCKAPGNSNIFCSCRSITILIIQYSIFGDFFLIFCQYVKWFTISITDGNHKLQFDSLYCHYKL